MFEAPKRYAEIREAYSFNSYVFSNKSVKPLQAADIIAYEWFKHVKNQILDGGKVPVRLSILDLLPKEGGNRYMTYWDKDRLELWFADCDKERPFGNHTLTELAAALKRS